MIPSIDNHKAMDIIVQILDEHRYKSNQSGESDFAIRSIA